MPSFDKSAKSAQNTAFQQSSKPFESFDVGGNAKSGADFDFMSPADRLRVDGIVQAAKARADAIEREAYEKGFAQGEKDGLEIGGKKMEKVLDRILQVAREMENFKHEFIRRYEKEILSLICHIAGKVIERNVILDHTIVRKAIFEALSFAVDRSEITIKVSPDDVEYVKELQPEFFEKLKDIKSVIIQAVPSVGPGGCLVETAFGNIDARVESQLEKIGRAIEMAFDATGEGNIV